MPQVELTSQLAQLAECPAIQSADGQTVHAVLEQIFGQHDQARQHILNQRGAVHSHLALFIDGKMIDHDQLQTEIGKDSKIFVMQALSGG